MARITIDSVQGVAVLGCGEVFELIPSTSQLDSSRNQKKKKARFSYFQRGKQQQQQQSPTRLRGNKRSHDSATVFRVPNDQEKQAAVRSLTPRSPSTKSVTTIVAPPPPSFSPQNLPTAANASDFQAKSHEEDLLTDNSITSQTETTEVPTPQPKAPEIIVPKEPKTVSTSGDNKASKETLVATSSPKVAITSPAPKSTQTATEPKATETKQKRGLFGGRLSPVRSAIATPVVAAKEAKIVPKEEDGVIKSIVPAAASVDGSNQEVNINVPSKSVTLVIPTDTASTDESSASSKKDSDSQGSNSFTTSMTDSNNSKSTSRSLDTKFTRKKSLLDDDITYDDDDAYSEIGAPARPGQYLMVAQDGKITTSNWDCVAMTGPCSDDLTLASTYYTGCSAGNDTRVSNVFTDLSFAMTEMCCRQYTEYDDNGSYDSSPVDPVQLYFG